jgi:hypothetical protein
MFALFQLRMGGNARIRQLDLPVIVLLLERQRVLGRRLIGQAFLIGRLQGLDFQPCRRQLRLGLLHRDFQAAGVEREQDGAGFHRLIVMDIDRFQPLGNIRADIDAALWT